MLDVVALDALAGPLLQEGLDLGRGLLRLQAERVAAEVGAGRGRGFGGAGKEGAALKVGFGGDDEFVAEVGERVCSIERFGML